MSACANTKLRIRCRPARSSSTSTARSRTTSRSSARSSAASSPSTASRCRRRSTTTSSPACPIRRSCARGSEPDHPDVDAVIDERVERYRAAVADGSSVHQHVREAVRYAAERCRSRSAPAPHAPRSSRSSRRRASARASRRSSRPTTSRTESPIPRATCRRCACSGIPRALVFEDTEAGIASAKGAGLRVIATRGTLDPERLRAADELVDRIDRELIERCLS